MQTFYKQFNPDLKPNLMHNLFSTHPCEASRLREMEYYFNQLTQSAGHTQVTPATPSKLHLRSRAREHGMLNN